MPAIVNGTDGITFPSWTTPTRPAVPVAGQAGFNTTIGAMETYTGSAWSTSDLPATGASGNFLQSNGTSWTSAPTLAVSNGGTGQTTLTTAYGVLAAGTTATGALQNIGTGTATQVLTSNGPGVLPSFQAAAAGGFSNMTVYTGPGTFTTPSTTTKIKVTVVGGGGGGGPSANPGGPSGTGYGGGGGGATIKIFTASASTPYPVTVGAGGGNASSGGTSSFGPVGGTTITATGGGGGSSVPNNDVGGSGGSGSSGDINIKGGGGTGGLTFLGQGGNSLLGGSTLSGRFPTGSPFPGIGSYPGSNYGGGGGGGWSMPGSGGTGTGGTGAGGVVIVEF
jgi:hypothetical protein